MSNSTRQALILSGSRPSHKKSGGFFREHRWLIGMTGKYLLVIAVFIAYSVMLWMLGARAARLKAEAKYNETFTAYQAEQAAIRLAEEEAAAEAAKPTYATIINSEAEALAKVLYGVKGNSTDDLRTYAWCVLNRVDNSAYPNTLAEVIAQPKQWMAYDPDAPVIESLYLIAYDVLEVWHSGGHRPVTSEYVYMNWSPTEIVLRDRWAEGSGTHYWRWK